MKISERTPTELKQLATLNTMLAKTSREEGGLIPALQTAQNLFGYVPHFAMEQISESLRIPCPQCMAWSLFIAFFSMKPRDLSGCV